MSPVKCPELIYGQTFALTAQERDEGGRRKGLLYDDKRKKGG